MYNRRPRGSQTIVGSQSIANKDDAAFRSASAPPTIVGLVEGRNHGISGEKTMTASALRLSAIFVMVLAGSTGAQRDAPKPSDGSAVIRGRVVAGDTLAPLRDVTLSLHHADKVPTLRTGVQVVDQSTFLPGLTSRPDAEGQFELVGVPPGRYRLGVTPGPGSARYLAVRYPDPAAEESQPLTVAAGQVLERIVVTLPRAAVISGRVVDESGNPLAHLSVSAQEMLAGERRRVAPSPGSASRTDDTGSFRLFGLRPGEYVLSAISPPVGMIPVGTGSIPGSPPTYYPGTGSLAQAARIRLAAGDEHGPVSFVFHQVRVSTIRGIVIDANGQPASTVSVNIRTTETTGTGSMTIGGRTTSSDGTFEMPRVPPGQFILSVSHYGPAGAQFGSIPLTVTDDVEGILIRLQPGITLNGQVVFDGEAPVPLPTMYVGAMPSRTGGANLSRVMPSADLSFKLENLFGPMFIRTDGPPGWHLKAVLLGGRDVAEQPVEFVSGGPPLQVVVSKRTASLSGVVSTAAGVPAESMVVLLNQDPATWQDGAATTRTVMTGSDGKYRLEGLRPGRFLAVATFRDDALVLSTSAAYFEMLAKHGTPVTIDDGESKTLDLKRVAVQ